MVRVEAIKSRMKESRGDFCTSVSVKSARHIDIFVYGCLLLLGGVQFYMCQRAEDFFTGDTTYFELARSLVKNRVYGFDFEPETLLPPGFPAILALLWVTFGSTYVVFIRSMSVFATLGFFAGYELLRHEEGRIFAAVSCLLLASSPIMFAFSTRMVFSDLPYFFTTMLALQLALKLDRSRNSPGRVLLWLLCGVSIVASLLIRSSGVALLVGLFAWLALSRFAAPEVRVYRLKTFLPLLLIGLLAQVLWTGWGAKHQSLQWPTVEGYPQPYIRQVKIKSGNYPELGPASLTDIPKRIAGNLNDRAVAVTQVLTRMDYINPAWVSPLVLAPVLLILLGVGGSVWRGGGGLPEWYFITHETLYLFWPWKFEIRFLLPVLPLVFLYLWRGCKLLSSMASKYFRTVSAWSCLVSLMLGMYAVIWAWYSVGLQPKVAAIIWISIAIGSFWGVRRNSSQPSAANGLLPRRVSEMKLRTISVVLTVLLLGVLFANGIIREISIGRSNVAFDLTKQPSYPDIEAAKWIESHTPITTVVMARQLDVVYHYSGRKVIWFPPTSNANVLMNGIHEHKVNDVIVITNRKSEYWLPREEDALATLVVSYPDDFHLRYKDPRFRIYEVIAASRRG